MTPCELPSVMRPRIDALGRPIRNSKGDIAYPGIISEMARKVTPPDASDMVMDSR